MFVTPSTMSVTPSDDTHLAGEERRRARDGNGYTLKEFLEHYGDRRGADYWNSADIHRAADERSGPSDGHANSSRESVAGDGTQESESSRIWNERPLYGDTNWNWHYPPAMFYQRIDKTKQALSDEEAVLIRRKYGWWLTDWQCWARLGLDPAQEQVQAAFEQRQRAREDLCFRRRSDQWR